MSSPVSAYTPASSPDLLPYLSTRKSPEILDIGRNSRNEIASSGYRKTGKKTRKTFPLKETIEIMAAPLVSSPRERLPATVRSLSRPSQYRDRQFEPSSCRFNANGLIFRSCSDTFSKTHASFQVQKSHTGWNATASGCNGDHPRRPVYPLATCIKQTSPRTAHLSITDSEMIQRLTVAGLMPTTPSFPRCWPPVTDVLHNGSCCIDHALVGYTS